jgi:hypothetical protein
MITGRAYDKTTNKPLPNLSILLDNADGNLNRSSDSVASVVTDTEGIYRIGGLPEGDYEISFNSNYTPFRNLTDGFTVKEIPPPVIYTIQLQGQLRIQGLSVRPGETTNDIDFPLALGTTVAGVVVNASGLPTGGIEVRAKSGSGAQNAMTKQDGSFRIGGLHTSSSLYLYAKGNGGATLRLGPYVLKQEGLSDVEIALEPAASVQGTLKDTQG